MSMQTADPVQPFRKATACQPPSLVVDDLDVVVVLGPVIADVEHPLSPRSYGSDPVAWRR
jgi:hypothetical protein